MKQNYLKSSCRMDLKQSSLILLQGPNVHSHLITHSGPMMVLNLMREVSLSRLPATMPIKIMFMMLSASKYWTMRGKATIAVCLLTDRQEQVNPIRW
jgi:hypothetical protein